MRREAHARPFLFHRMEPRDHRARQRSPCPVGRAVTASPPFRIDAHQQRLGARAVDTVLASLQRDRPRRIDAPSSDRQVGERAPDGLGKEAPEMEFDFRPGSERVETDLQTTWCAGVELSADTRKETTMAPPQPSSAAGIAVRCSRNLRQVRRNSAPSRIFRRRPYIPEAALRIRNCADPAALSVFSRVCRERSATRVSEKPFANLRPGKAASWMSGDLVQSDTQVVLTDHLVLEHLVQQP